MNQVNADAAAKKAKKAKEAAPVAAKPVAPAQKPAQKVDSTASLAKAAKDAAASAEFTRKIVAEAAKIGAEMKQDCERDKERVTAKDVEPAGDEKPKKDGK